MILNHIWGLYTHPREEWKSIENKHESLIHSLTHILTVALIPSICGYFAAAHIGWSIGTGEVIKLTSQSAMFMSAAMYCAIIGSILALAVLIGWMAKTFDSKPEFSQSLEIAAYASTPILMSGLAALYPVLWFVVVVGMLALSYSVYLLYSGVPIVMRIPDEKGFIYASSVVTCGLVLLVSVMAVSAIFWSLGLGPEYVP